MSAVKVITDLIHGTMEQFKLTRFQRSRWQRYSLSASARKLSNPQRKLSLLPSIAMRRRLLSSQPRQCPRIRRIYSLNEGKILKRAETIHLTAAKTFLMTKLIVQRSVDMTDSSNTATSS